MGADVQLKSFLNSTLNGVNYELDTPISLSSETAPTDFNGIGSYVGSKDGME
jgi:hypothetical protein